MDCDQISPCLLVGTCPIDATDVDELGRLGVTAVLNVQTDADLAVWGIRWDALEAQYRASNIDARRVPIRDFDPDALRRSLPKCVEVLDEFVRGGHTVYVHCTAGINRSPSTVISYLHWIEGQDLDEAVAHVTQCRCCDPYVEAIRLATQDRKSSESA